MQTIKVVIVEDEMPAQKKLRRFLAELDTAIEIIAEINTVASGISFLKSHQADLIFSDIELLDGNAFEIYSQVPVTCPIIFTTAYDQFWMNAFESNGIDYLMKPFSQERFRKAWDKFMKLSHSTQDNHQLLNNLAKVIEQSVAKKSYKKRFTVHHHQGMYFLDTDNIAYFEASAGLIYAYDIAGKKHLLSIATLKEIEEQVDPSAFFRINRSELVNKLHIEKIVPYTKNALAIQLKGSGRQLTTSQHNTAEFRSWIEQ